MRSLHLPHQFNQRFPLILPIYIPTLILAFCLALLIPVLPLYSLTFGVSYSLVGLVIAAMGIGNILGDVPAGILLRRIGEKRTMQIGIAITGLSILALTFSRSFFELVFYNIIAGVGWSLWNIARHTYIRRWTAIVRRGRAIAIYGGIHRIGIFVGPVVGGIIATNYSFQTPFLLFAGLSAVAFLFPTIFASDAVAPSGTSDAKIEKRKISLIHTVSPNHPKTTKTNGLQHHLYNLGQLVHREFSILGPAGLGQFLAQMIRAGRKIVIPLYAADVLGLDAESIGWILGISGALDMVLFLPAGMIMDWLGRKFAIIPCFFIQGIGMALIPLTVGYSSLLAAACVIGFGNGLGSGTMMTLGADLAPEDSVSEFLGIWRLIGDTGQAGGPIVIGTIAALMGLPMATLTIAGVGIAAATVFGLFVPETLVRTSKITSQVAPD